MGLNNKKRRNRNKRFIKKRLPANKPPMEDLMVNAREHAVLKKFSKNWEKRFDVQIRMPKTRSLDSDVIFVSIEGHDSNRNCVKKFLAEKMRESIHVEPSEEDNVVLITLSESESEEESSESEEESTGISVIDLDSEDIVKTEQQVVPEVSLDASVCIIDDPTSSSNLQTVKNGGTAQKKRKAGKMKVTSKNVSSSEALDSCEVTSTTDNDMVRKKAKLSESVVIIEEPSTSSKPTLDFIPLIPETNSVNQKNELENKNSCSKSKNSNEINNDDIVIIDEPECTVTPQRLRPVVIDGSNVAMEHGKTTRSFSVKGIKLAIDYFLNRGHTQVTAFVPKFRRNQNPNRTVPTTDVQLFDELERKQQVVFTPSRRVNGRFISSYDDRFIVQLAASNGGVIVSNDNYRDLINDSESFKEAIEQRLLMFCYVGDIFMIPDDPLGRRGPKLNDFLSFPPPPKDEEKKKKQ